MSDDQKWVMDTSTFTHLCRARHEYIIRQLTPAGVVLIPSEVNTEIENGRERYPRIPAVSALSWAETVVLSDDENWTLLELKADRGGDDPLEHLGECAVIAYAKHNSLIAVLDEWDAVQQAIDHDVETVGTMWLVVEAYLKLFGRDGDRAAAVIDDLLETGMRLPIKSGASLIAWAYENEYLPK